MYEKILVPLDGSDLAEQVFPHVAELARAFGSEVVFIEICEPEEREYSQTCQIYMDYEAENLQSSLKGSAAKVSTVVLIGKPAMEILNYARENDVELIVMASHGRSGVMPWSLGSTVSRVLHKTHLPLIVVRAEETPEERGKTGLFSRILVPLDGSEEKAAILPYVAELTKKLKSEVTLLHVVEAGKHVHTVGGLNYIHYKDQDMESMKARKGEYLDKESAKFEGTKAAVRSEIRVGDSAKEIAKSASEIDCSLIAMSSHGYSGFETWLHGSVIYKILQASDKPMLLVPPPGTHK